MSAAVAFESKEDFAKLLEESFKDDVQENALVTGKVIGKNKDVVTVDVGFKNEAHIPVREFSIFNIEPKEGDEIEVYVEQLENSHGELVLSFEKAIREKSWHKFEKAHEAGENVDGVIFSRVKGGFTVDLGGAVAFLPGSQVDVRPVKDVTPLMNITQPFQILKMDKKRGNIVVSRRAILEESRSHERDEMLSNIGEGSVLDGTVKNITDYGAFVDLGAVDGLLHVTDISWKRINHPSEVLTVGEVIKVKVIKYDEDTKRVSLGLKQLEENPWQDIEDRFPTGSKHKGTITNVADYGAFVELGEGIEGLVHVSEMSWTKKNVHPSRIVSVGQEVDVEVLDFDQEKHRISLGIKQCEENPWDNFTKEHPAGSTFKGEIKSITEFGLFVGINEHLDGLVHINDIAWEGAEEAMKSYNKGDQVEVKILSVEPEKERISLGIKQLESDPFEETAGKFKKNGVGTFEVSDVNDDGIEVKLDEGLFGFIKRSELAVDKVECRPDRFAVGDRVDAKIKSVDKNSRKFTLSIKALELDEQKKAIKEFGSTDSGASLGDILGVALDSAKEEQKSAKAKKSDKKED